MMTIRATDYDYVSEEGWLDFDGSEAYLEMTTLDDLAGAVDCTSYYEGEHE